MAFQDTERDIIALYQRGLSVPEMATRCAVSDKRIYYVLQKNGVTLRPRGGVGKVLRLAQEAEIAAAYRSGTDAIQLAERYGVGSTTIYGVLERIGVARRTNHEVFRKLSDLQEGEVIALYGQGLPASKIVGRYGIEEQTVYNSLERHGVNRRSGSEAMTVYPRNEHAFDVIESEEAAYWLGFIAADGNVSNGRLRIGLSTRDVGHLRKFCAWLASDRPIYSGVNTHGRPVSTCEISSARLVEALGAYGIVPRKTYVMKRLPAVPQTLVRHLLRGYVDADGYFALRPTGRVTFGVGSYSREIVEEIQEWCIAEIGVRRTALVPSRTVWHYRQYATHEIGAIAAHLYEGASVSLARKHATAQRVMRRELATMMGRVAALD